MKALVNGRRIVSELKRKQGASTVQPGRGMVSKQKFAELSSIRCCSTLKSDDCKFRSYSCSEKHILRNYQKFTRSGLPQRVLYHYNGEWEDFPENIICLVQEDFRMKKTISEVTCQNQQLLLDFVHMICVDTSTELSKPVAWIDNNGSCFFPEFCSYTHVESDKGNHIHMPCESNGAREMHAHFNISVNAAESSNAKAANREGFFNGKRIRSVSINSYNREKTIYVSDNKNLSAKAQEAFVENEGIISVSSPENISKIIKVVSDNENISAELKEAVGENEPCAVFLPEPYSSRPLQENAAKPATGANIHGALQKMLLHGLGSRIDANDIVRISRPPLLNMIGQIRFELFRKEAEVIKNLRGSENVRYAWLSSSRDAVEDLMLKGAMKIMKPLHGPECGVGVHLAPANCSNIW